MDLARCYKSFSMIQTVAKWAAIIGGIQSVTWIILSIISILMYFCVFDLDNKVSYGSITKFILNEMYFRGNCEQDYPPNIVYTNHLKSVNTVLNSAWILTFAFIYLGVSLVWLTSSCLLLTHVKKSNITVSMVVLYTWASVTLITCCIDLGLGVIFGIDFGKYQSKATQYNLDPSGIGNVDYNGVQLLAAAFSAIFMMLISMKGFILWLINFGLMIYVFIGAYVARDTVNDFINHTFNNTHTSPIHAFEPKDESTGFDNAAFVVEQRQHNTPLELNEESIKRAARMSMDNLQERRFRNIDSFEQYPPPKLPQLPLQQPSQQQQQGQIMNYELPTLPAPDYTPPMPRSNQNGQVRNSRY